LTGVRSILRATPEHLRTASFVGLAAFVPFSIAGANAAIMVGLLASLLGVVVDPESRERYRAIGRDPMLYASALLVLSALPSVFMSEEIHRALRDLKSYWILLVYFLVAYNLVSARRRRHVFWVLFGSMSASALVALVQYSGGIDLMFIHIAPQSYRPGSTLYNMTFAGILYQLIALNVAVALCYRASSRKFVVLGAGVLMQVASLVLTLTRGAWIALVGGLLAVPALLRRKRLFIGVTALLLVAIIVALQNDAIRERARTMVDNVRSPTDKNISTRLVLWDIAWDVFTAHPVLGVGMGDYTLEAEKLLHGRFVTTAVDAHNIYLQLLATRGLVGFIPFVVFWVVLFRVLIGAKGLAERKGDRFGAHLATGVIAAAVAVLIGAVSENNIDDSEVLICFMLLVGMARSVGLAHD
jgi:O-antigen ligase